MSDTPETDAEELVQIGNDWRFVNVDFARNLERERDEAGEKLSDWEDSAKHVRSEWPDEKHCSCVPILRKLLRDAERERDEYRRNLELIAEDCEAWLNSENDEPSADFIKLVAKYAREAIK
jgi:hypothetical protein